MKVTYSQVLGIRTWTSLEAIILPIQSLWTRPMAFLGLSFSVLKCVLLYVKFLTERNYFWSFEETQ